MSKEEVDFDALERHAANQTVETVIEPLRIAVVGCRDYDNFDFFSERLTEYLKQAKLLHPDRPIEIASGGAAGIDDMAEDYALDHGYAFRRFDADWDQFPKIAGFLRNQKLAESVDWVLSYWDGKSTGTLDMRERAMQLRRRLKTIKIDTTQKRYYCRRKLQEWDHKRKTG